MEGEYVVIVQNINWIKNRLQVTYILLHMSRSQYMTRRTSRANAWTSLPPAKTLWSVDLTTFAHWRWSVGRKSQPCYPCCEKNRNLHWLFLIQLLQIFNFAVVWCSLTFLCTCLLGQLGGLWALQLLWATVYPGERRLPSLGIMEWQQRLPCWKTDVLPPNLQCCESHSRFLQYLHLQHWAYALT